ncbi:glycosyltransferase family 2 protein [Hyphomicrobium facile]|uniref:Glycosyl transferase family 2 n=1 Tax=Hyphomicrobium facile TaxID=51670 RepID=A0A1I7NF43_9HYPH|nr:glycosyltransferase [Hyphomicrobium facile]SFV33166.1 Glycosyl transferase family 2 [Hyphomicrobium facile]
MNTVSNIEAACVASSSFDDQFRVPSVSVILTNYNYLSFVKAAIESVARQTYPHFECIIVDDRSRDGSAEFITTFLRELNDDRFRFIRLGSNLGQMGAMLAGLENSSGVFVSFLDADDVLLPNFLEVHIRAHLNSSFSAGITASDSYQIDEDGQILESTFHMLAKNRTPDSSSASKLIPVTAVPVSVSTAVERHPSAQMEFLYLERGVAGWNTSACSSLMFRRDLLRLILPQNIGPFRICADYFFATLGHLISGTIIVSEPLVGWRLHRKNNFSKNAIIGGRYMPATFDRSSALNFEIARYVMTNFDRLSPVIGATLCKDIVRRFVSKKRLYKATKGANSFRRYMGSGSDRKFWWKYAVYHRYIKRH